MEYARSVNGVAIRLTSERWVHIVENHDDLAGKFYDVLEGIADPDVVLRGATDECLALRRGKPFDLVVIYRETSSADGFVITAFQTSKSKQLIGTKKTIWRKQKSRKS